MYEVVLEFVLGDKTIREMIEVYADTEQEASDIAYERVRRENPSVSAIDVLSVLDPTAA